MKAVFGLVLLGLIASALATDNSDLTDKSLAKESQDKASALPVITTPVSDNVSVPSSTANPGDSSSTSAQPGDESKPKFCTRQYAPVCASNLKTFNNQCEFENAQKLDPSLTVTKQGVC